MMIKRFIQNLFFPSYTLLVLSIGILVSCSSNNVLEEPVFSYPQNPISIPWMFFFEERDNGGTIYRADTTNINALEEVFPIEWDKPYRIFLSPNGAYAIIRQDISLLVMDLHSKEILAHIDPAPRPTTQFTTVEVDNGVTWSPTSDKFAFLIDDPMGFTDILMYDLPSKTLTNLTNNLARENAPAWSSDGQKLAFASIENCGRNLSECAVEKQYWDIFVLDTNTLNRQRITDFSSKIFIEGDWIDNSLCDLHWSPDQKYISFRSYCPSEGISSFDEIYLADVSNSKVIKLTEFGDIDYSVFYSPAWSVDSQYLMIAYNKNFIFDDIKDLNGFLLYDIVGEQIVSYEFPQINFSAFHLHWSPMADYAVSNSLNSDESHLFAVSEGTIELIATNYLSVSHGLWVDDGFIAQQGNRLIKIGIPNGQAVDMQIELADNVIILEGK